LISFRYHLVSIVAVFLAVGLGILAGTTVINQTLVNNLQNRTDRLEQQRDQANNRLTRMQTFATLLVPHIIGDRLDGQDVIVIHDGNTDGDAVATAHKYLSDAGATLVADFSVTSEMAAADSATQQDLGDALDVLATEAVSIEAARALADRFAAGRAIREPRPPGSDNRPDLLKELLSEPGFLTDPNITNADLPKIGGPGQMVVVLGGGQSDPAVPFDSFLLPFVERLLQDRVHVAVAEATRAPNSLVEEVRSDPDISDRDGMVTVDDLNGSTFYGGVGLVLGLDVLNSGGTGGDYGVKDGASDLIPPQP
jgi:hypothetical protein